MPLLFCSPLSRSRHWVLLQPLHLQGQCLLFPGSRASGSAGSGASNLVFTPLHEVGRASTPTHWPSTFFYSRSRQTSNWLFVYPHFPSSSWTQHPQRTSRRACRQPRVPPVHHQYPRQPHSTRSRSTDASTCRPSAHSESGKNLRPSLLFSVFKSNACSY